MIKTKFAVQILLLLIPALISVANADADQAVSSTKEGSVRPGGCLTGAEAELGRLVDKLREEQHLPPIPVVEPLYRVAKWHVIDLATNTPHQDHRDDRGIACNLHSWSNKGKETGGWEPLCYTPDHKQALGMWQKPREISDFRSNAYENVYWTSAPFSPAMAINYWKGSNDELDLILARKNWAGRTWRSMGVGVFGNYAAVWFSEKSAPDSRLSRCEKDGM